MDITKLNEMELTGLIAQEQNKMNSAIQNIITLNVQLQLNQLKPKEPIKVAELVK